MTTRAQLESEREALRGLRDFAISKYARGQSDDENYDPRIWPWDESEVAALTASIARVEALLSLSDEACAFVDATLWSRAEDCQEEASVAACHQDKRAHDDQMAAYAALRTVANLIRREPRGDV